MTYLDIPPLMPKSPRFGAGHNRLRQTATQKPAVSAAPDTAARRSPSGLTLAGAMMLLGLMPMGMAAGQISAPQGSRPAEKAAPVTAPHDTPAEKNSTVEGTVHRVPGRNLNAVNRWAVKGKDSKLYLLRAKTDKETQALYEKLARWSKLPLAGAFKVKATGVVDSTVNGFGDLPKVTVDQLQLATKLGVTGTLKLHGRSKTATLTNKNDQTYILNNVDKDTRNAPWFKTGQAVKATGDVPDPDEIYIVDGVDFSISGTRMNNTKLETPQK